MKIQLSNTTNLLALSGTDLLFELKERKYGGLEKLAKRLESQQTIKELENWKRARKFTNILSTDTVMNQMAKGRMEVILY